MVWVMKGAERVQISKRKHYYLVNEAYCRLPKGERQALLTAYKDERRRNPQVRWGQWIMQQLQKIPLDPDSPRWR
jgi:hypothetical protein